MQRGRRHWIVFSLCLLLGCGGSSNGGKAQNAEPLRGEEGATAAVGSSLGLAGALSVLVLDPPAVNATAAAPSAAAVASGALLVPCPLGGSVNSDCRERAGQTVVSTVLAGCTEAVGERTLVSDGHVTWTIEAPGLCGRPLPPGVAVATEMRDFSALVEEAGQVVDELEAPRLSQRFVPVSSGCSGGDGVLTLSGRFSARRGVAVDVDVETEELVVDVRSRGVPCRQTATANGDVALRDRVRDNELTALLDGFALSSVVDPVAGVLVGVDGVFVSDCNIAAEVTTEEMFPIDAACPASGAIAVRLADGTGLRAAFSAAGVALDYGIDGVVDVAAQPCSAAPPTCAR